MYTEVPKSYLNVFILQRKYVIKKSPTSEHYCLISKINLPY